MKKSVDLQAGQIVCESEIDYLSGEPNPPASFAFREKRKKFFPSPPLAHPL